MSGADVEDMDPGVPDMDANFHVCIVGSGMSGLCMGACLFLLLPSLPIIRGSGSLWCPPLRLLLRLLLLVLLLPLVLLLIRLLLLIMLRSSAPVYPGL